MVVWWCGVVVWSGGVVVWWCGVAVMVDKEKRRGRLADANYHCLLRVQGGRAAGGGSGGEVERGEENEGMRSRGEENERRMRE